MREHRSVVLCAIAVCTLAWNSAATAANPTPWQTRAAKRLERATRVPVLGRLVLPVAARLGVAGLRAADPAVETAYVAGRERDWKSFSRRTSRGFAHLVNGVVLMTVLSSFIPFNWTSGPAELARVLTGLVGLSAGAALAIEARAHLLSARAGNTAAVVEALRLPRLDAAAHRVHDVLARGKLLPVE
ncbi:MAG: hypothetical protein IT371_11930 [Deltaproteobacteria bacterium]|nr:hypothetical protein [Deltaproteobacteria bacterium]